MWFSTSIYTRCYCLHPLEARLQLASTGQNMNMIFLSAKKKYIYILVKKQFSFSGRHTFEHWNILTSCVERSSLSVLETNYSIFCGVYFSSLNDCGLQNVLRNKNFFFYKSLVLSNYFLFCHIVLRWWKHQTKALAYKEWNIHSCWEAFTTYGKELKKKIL